MKTYKIVITILLFGLAQACGPVPVSATGAADTTPCQAGSDGDGRLERVCTDIHVVDRASLSLVPDVAFKLTLLATLKPPTSNGVTLQATDVILGSKNQAIVSFNVAGATQMGALDMIDVSDISKPTLTSQMILPSSDVNALARSGDRIYAVGASTTQGAVLNTIDIVNNKLSDTSLATYPIPSYAGTSVAVQNGLVAVASGDTGGFKVFNKSDLTTATQTQSIADARALRYDSSGKLLVLSGQPGAVRTYSTAGALTSTTALGGNSIAESKSTIEVHDSVYVASTGDTGVKIICTADGGTLATVAPITISGVPSARTVTNAATLSNGLLFTANGEAGVTVYYVRTNGKKTGVCSSLDVTEVGALSLGAGFSANNIYYSNGNIFVASGSGGLIILRLNYALSLLDYTADLIAKIGEDFF